MLSTIILPRMSADMQERYLTEIMTAHRMCLVLKALRLLEAIHR